MEALHHILQAQPLVLQQHRQVVEQVSGFVDELFSVFRHGGQGYFHSLFTHLLGDALGALAIEAGGVAGGGVCPLARGQDLLELGEEAERRQRVTVEAGGGAQVAGGADRIGGDQQGVLIAVGADGHEPQHMT
ncbi:hypothetical protein D3C84_997630 [compost metagenome]